MVKLFTAIDANNLSTRAKKSIVEQKRLALKTKENQKKNIEAIEKGWLKQKQIMLLAAIDGSVEVTFQDQVFLIENLLQLGFNVFECGWVKNQEVIDLTKFYDTKENINDREKWIINLLHGTRELLEEFIKEAENDMSTYYGGQKKFHSKMHDAFNEVLGSMSDDVTVFDGDHTMWVSVPDRLRFKYRIHFKHISNAISYFKKARANPNYKTREMSIVELPEFIDGKYRFSIDDEMVKVLLPQKKEHSIILNNNFFKVEWGGKSNSKLLNEPLFSQTGLLWISKKYGQELIESIISTLKKASEQAKSNFILNFEKNNHHWYFKNHFSPDTLSCNPEDIIDILLLARYKITNIKSSENIFNIYVGW